MPSVLDKAGIGSYSALGSPAGQSFGQGVCLPRVCLEGAVRNPALGLVFPPPLLGPVGHPWGELPSYTGTAGGEAFG